MDNQIQLTTIDRKIEFLKTVIEAADKRRDAVENRFSILIASNAILLTIIITVGISSGLKNGPTYWLQVIFTVVALVTVLLSILWSAQIFVPMPKQKQRSRIMDVPKDSVSEHNLYLFIRIADFKKDEYRREINALTEQEIFEQFLSEAHNLSRLLQFRYAIMARANMAFAIGTVAFTALTLTRLLS